jgi:hypothetical protein
MQPPAPRDLRGRRAHHPDRNRTDRGKAFYPIRCPQRARARRAPIPASTDVDRPARAGWAALRLLADVALFSGIVVRRFWFGATMELGRSGRSMMMMDAAPAAPHLDLLGPPGWCSGCWPHDGDVAGGAGFLFSDTPVRGRRWSSGDRSDRRCGRCGATGPTAPTARIERRVEGVPLWSYRAEAADTPGRKPRSNKDPRCADFGQPLLASHLQNVRTEGGGKVRTVHESMAYSSINLF